MKTQRTRFGALTLVGLISLIALLTGVWNHAIPMTLASHVAAAKRSSLQCSYNISPQSNVFGPSGGNSTFGVITDPGCSWSATTSLPWIGMIISSGTGSGTVSYGVLSNSGGPRTGGITVTGGATFLIQQQGALSSVNGASFTTPIAPESIVAAFGNGLANTTQSASTNPPPTTLGGTSVTVRDSAGTSRDAGIFYVSPTQVNYQVPAGTATGTATVTVLAPGGSSVGAVQIATVAPGLFSANGSGSGLASGLLLRIHNGVQTYESLSNPIVFNGDQLFLILYGTGIRYRSSISAVTATIGGVTTAATYAGAQGTYTGEDQVNLGGLSSSLAGRGTVNVILTVDGSTANTVQVTFQ